MLFCSIETELPGVNIIESDFWFQQIHVGKCLSNRNTWDMAIHQMFSIEELKAVFFLFAGIFLNKKSKG